MLGSVMLCEFAWCLGGMSGWFRRAGLARWFGGGGLAFMARLDGPGPSASMVRQGRRVVNKTYSAPGSWPQLTVSVWARVLTGVKVPMVFVNNCKSTMTIVCDSICWAQLPFKSGMEFDVRDLWSRESAVNGTAIAGEDYIAKVLYGEGMSQMLLFVPQMALLV